MIDKLIRLENGNWIYPLTVNAIHVNPSVSGTNIVDTVLVMTDRPSSSEIVFGSDTDAHQYADALAAIVNQAHRAVAGSAEKEEAHV